MFSSFRHRVAVGMESRPRYELNAGLAVYLVIRGYAPAIDVPLPGALCTGISPPSISARALMQTCCD
jgi:hypothetical protein